MSVLPFQTPQAKAKAEATRQARRNGQLPPLPTMRELKLAISWKCQECMGGGRGLSTPMADIRDCSATPLSETPCALWDFRPYQ